MFMHASLLIEVIKQRGVGGLAVFIVSTEKPKSLKRQRKHTKNNNPQSLTNLFSWEKHQYMMSTSDTYLFFHTK